MNKQDNLDQWFSNELDSMGEATIFDKLEFTQYLPSKFYMHIECFGESRARDLADLFELGVDIGRTSITKKLKLFNLNYEGVHLWLLAKNVTAVKKLIKDAIKEYKRLEQRAE